MKIFTLIVRSLMGLLFVFGAVVYFLKLVPVPPVTGDLKTFNEGLAASHYLVPTVKAIELVCGLAFLTGRFVPLAAVLIAPIIVNIVLVNAFLYPSGLPLALALAAINGWLGYVHRDRYKPLFTL